MDGQQDHNLLIELNVKVERLIADVKEVKDNTAKRVDSLEIEKIDKEEAYRLKREADEVHESFNKRITWLERIAYGGIGALALLEFYFRFISK